MSADEANKAVVRRFYAEIDAGNLDAMDELVARTTLTTIRLPSRILSQGVPD